MRPDLHVVVVGPQRHANFRAFPNLHRLGMRSREDVPGYLQHCDVGLIPFDVVGHRDLVASINPLKLYEYMAAGLPVVSADWPAVRRLNSPAVLYDDVTGFPSAVSHAIDDGDGLGAYGRAWVASANWTARLAPLEDKLREWNLR
jgi:glycosyltransferase involved in cell wall biosynthesis